MAIAPLFLDTNVFLYAAGGEHPLRDPSRAVLDRWETGSVAATTSSEVVQEILYVLRRRGEHEKGLFLARRVMSLFPDLLPVTREAMELACEIVEVQPGLPTRDAVHVGTMLHHGITRIVSTDADFDSVAEITRLSPVDVTRSSDLP